MSSTCVTPETENHENSTSNFWAAWGTHSKCGFEEMKYVAHTSLWHYNACLVGNCPTQLSSGPRDLGSNGIWLVVEPTHLKNMNVNLENLPQIGNRGENMFKKI